MGLNGRLFSFGPDVVKNIVDHLDNYFEQDYDVSTIGALNDLAVYATMRVMFNIKIGTFDKWLEEDNEEAKTESIESSKHLRSVSVVFRHNYEITGLTEDNRFIFHKTVSYFTVEDVIKVKEAIPDFENYPNNKSLLDLVNDGEYVNERLIWNIEEGIFDEWINLYLQNKYDDAEIDITVEEDTEKDILADESWRDYHPFFKKLDIPEPAQWPYEFKKWSSMGKSDFHLPGHYTFTLLDILYIKDRLDDYHKRNYTALDIAEDVGITVNTANRILYNLANGLFDEYLERYVKFNDYKFNIIPPKYRYPVLDVKIIDDEVKVSYLGFTLPNRYPLSLIRFIKMNYDSWNDDHSFIADILKDIEQFGGVVMDDKRFSHKMLSNLIYNIIYPEDSFTFVVNNDLEDDPNCDPFLHQDHCFESKSGMLFIDGVETNLTIAKVNLMIHEYINANDKDECVRRMAKSYYMVDEKHVKLVCYYWDNPAFRKLRKSDADKVAMINDPHKRPASNTPVYV